MALFSFNFQSTTTMKKYFLLFGAAALGSAALMSFGEEKLTDEQKIKSLLDNLIAQFRAEKAIECRDNALATATTIAMDSFARHHKSAPVKPVTPVTPVKPVVKPVVKPPVKPVVKPVKPVTPVAPVTPVKPAVKPEEATGTRRTEASEQQTGTATGTRRTEATEQQTGTATGKRRTD